MAKEFNYWKVIAILFFLFGVVLFFYSQNQNKQTVKLNHCVNILNQTLIGWHDSMISVGKYCFNMTEAEIESHIQNNSFNDLNKGELK